MLPHARKCWRPDLQHAPCSHVSRPIMAGQPHQTTCLRLLQAVGYKSLDLRLRTASARAVLGRGCT